MGRFQYSHGKITRDSGFLSLSFRSRYMPSNSDRVVHCINIHPALSLRPLTPRSKKYLNIQPFKKPIVTNGIRNAANPEINDIAVSLRI